MRQKSKLQNADPQFVLCTLRTFYIDEDVNVA